MLDLVLRHAIDQILSGKKISPNISFDFVQEASDNYEDLISNFQQCDVKIKVKNIKWCNDMQFLYQLGNAYRYYQEHSIFPFITFKTLPNVSNTRWNS